MVKRVVADFLDVLAEDDASGWRTRAERILSATKLRDYADALASYLPPRAQP
jgi:hypothetical protein